VADTFIAASVLPEMAPSSNEASPREQAYREKLYHLNKNEGGEPSMARRFVLYAECLF
jgi:hypothetical protein